MTETQYWKIMEELLFVGKVEFDVKNGTLSVTDKNGKVYSYKGTGDAKNILDDFINKYKDIFTYSYTHIVLKPEELVQGKEYFIKGITVDSKTVEQPLIYKGKLSQSYLMFEKDDKEYVFRSVEAYNVR